MCDREDGGLAVRALLILLGFLAVGLSGAQLPNALAAPTFTLEDADAGGSLEFRYLAAR